MRCYKILNFMCAFAPPCRHTNTDSVKMLVYEGVKTTSFSEEPAVEVDELVSYDIVLTTYDVLKEDLSHDSDRHEGDRRFMRYQKRFHLSSIFIGFYVCPLISLSKKPQPKQKDQFKEIYLE